VSGPGLYWRYIVNCLRAQMLYPTAFLLRLVTQFLVTIVEFGGLYALFARFNHIRGWHFPEIALFYGVYRMVLVVADARLQERIAGPARATVTSVANVVAELPAFAVYAAWAMGGMPGVIVLVVAVAGALPVLLRVPLSP